MSTDAGQLLNVFSLEEIQLINNMVCKIKDHPGLIYSDTQLIARTNGFQQKSLVYKFVEKTVVSKAEKLLNRKLHLGTGMLLDARIPFKIHTDYVKNDQHPDMVLLIPLNLEPLQTNTIIFNEVCCDHFDQYRQNNNKLEHNALGLHPTLMSHETVDHLEYVSLLKICPWHPGSLIYWDRKLLHASDNFSNCVISCESRFKPCFTN